MKVVVLGAGVVGVTTAYELAKDGHDVTVIDRCAGPGLETSHANGGQLSWDHAEPLPGPGVMQKAIKWLGKRNAPLLFRLRLDPALWSWTLKFFANCSEPNFWHNAEHLLQLALYARERIQELLKTESIAFDHRRGGILGLYQDAREFDQEVDAIRSWREIDGSRRALDRHGCIELEPSLKHATMLIAGGVHTPHDESGDCYAFTQQLADRAQAMGVTFQWNTTVHGLKRDAWHISSAITDQGEFAAEAFVLALGSYSPLAMRGLDLDLPIYPAKGYSITAPLLDETMAPKISITCNTHKLVLTRMGDRLRVGGMLELGRGHDTTIDEARARLVLANTMKLFPGAIDPSQATFWTGLRPLTPDSLPIIGRAKQHNLFLNTGHGMLGWTLAAGSARIAADLVGGHAPAIDIEGLGWERFA